MKTYDIDLILMKGDIKKLNKTFDAWYLRATTYYKRQIDIVVNFRHNKVMCECAYQSICAKNNKECVYVKACREFIKRQEDNNGRIDQ